MCRSRILETAAAVLMWWWWELSPALLWCPGLCCWGGSSSQPLQPCPGPSDLDTTWSPCPILHTPCPILLRRLSRFYGQTGPFIGSPTLNKTPSSSATTGGCRRRSEGGRRPWWEETPLPWRRLQHGSHRWVWSNYSCAAGATNTTIINIVFLLEKQMIKPRGPEDRLAESKYWVKQKYIKPGHKSYICRRFM